MTKASKVGAITLLIFAIFFYCYPSNSTRDSDILNKEFRLIFPQVCGLREGCSVNFSGVTVGRVESIDFTTPEQRHEFGEDGRVIVTCITDYDVVIPEDSSAGVGQKTGSTYWIEIIPGLSATSLKPDSTARLRLLNSSTEQFTQGLAKMSELREKTKELRTLINDPQFRRRLGDMASNARFYTNEAKALSKNAKTMVHDMDKNLDDAQDSMLQQLKRIDVQVAQGKARLQSFFPKVNEKVEAWEARMKSSNQQIDGLLRMAVKETQRFNELSAKADHMLQTNSASLQAKKEQLHKLAAKLENVASLAEDIGMLVSDPEVKQSLKDIAAKYREQSATLLRKLHKYEGKNDPEPSPEATTETTPASPEVSKTITETPSANTEESDSLP